MANEETVVDSSSGRATGLLASLQRLLATSVEVVHTRVEILATELEEEGGRVRELLLYERVSLFFFGLGLILMTLFVVAAFWDTHRQAVLAGFAIVYLAMGAGTALMVRHKLRTRPRLFSASLAELGKDRARLVSRS